MKTGIQLITKERKEQIEKHGVTILADVINNNGEFERDGEAFKQPQLAEGARLLLYHDDDLVRSFLDADIFIPHEWDKERWIKMLNKPYRERLIIAGALIAAEIDRIQYPQNK